MGKTTIALLPARSARQASHWSGRKSCFPNLERSRPTATSRGTSTAAARLGCFGAGSEPPGAPGGRFVPGPCPDLRRTCCATAASRASSSSWLSSGSRLGSGAAGAAAGPPVPSGGGAFSSPGWSALAAAFGAVAAGVPRASAAASCCFRARFSSRSRSSSPSSSAVAGAPSPSPGGPPPPSAGAGGGAAASSSDSCVRSMNTSSGMSGAPALPPHPEAEGREGPEARAFAAALLSSTSGRREGTSRKTEHSPGERAPCRRTSCAIGPIGPWPPGTRRHKPGRRAEPLQICWRQRKPRVQLQGHWRGGPPPLDPGRWTPAAGDLEALRGCGSDALPEGLGLRTRRRPWRRQAGR